MNTSALHVSYQQQHEGLQRGTRAVGPLVHSIHEFHHASNGGVEAHLLRLDGHLPCVGESGASSLDTLLFK